MRGEWWKIWRFVLKRFEKNTPTRPGPDGGPSDWKANRRLGAKGEKLAKKTLEKKGYRHIVSNYRNKTGEIDLIMQDGRTVVFIEVKTRRSEDFVATESVVNYKKQKTISKVARHYVSRYKLQQYSGRFDVVVVIMPEKGKTTIRHHIDAFAYRR